MEYTRLMFDFSTKAVKRLDEIVKYTGYDKRSAVIRDALRLFEYSIKLLRDGWTLKFSKEGEEDITFKEEDLKKKDTNVEIKK